MGRLPDILSKWMMGYGAGVVLDALLVFIVDLSVGNFNCEKDYLCRSSYSESRCDSSLVVSSALPVSSFF